MTAHAEPLIWTETRTPPAFSSAFCAHLLPRERRSTYANEQWQRYCGRNINGVITAQPALLSPPPLPGFISQPSYGSPSGGRRRQQPRSPDPELITEAQVQALRETALGSWDTDVAKRGLRCQRTITTAHLMINVWWCLVMWCVKARNDAFV